MSDVIVSRKEKSVFHEMFCPYVSKIGDINKKQIDEREAKKFGYHECKFCRSVRGIVYKYKISTNLDVSYDPIDNAVCLRTPIGFWKLIWRDNIETWQLFHMNHRGWKCFNEKYPSKLLMRGSFHRQDDFRSTTSVQKAFDYIISHDKNYKLADEDIRKLKKTTKKTKKKISPAKK